MLAAILTVTLSYMAAMLVLGMRLGRKFRRLNAELDLIEAARPL